MPRFQWPLSFLLSAAVCGLSALSGQAVIDWQGARQRIRNADTTFRQERFNLQAVTDPVNKRALYPRPRVEGFIRSNQERVTGAIKEPVLRGLRDHVRLYSDAAIGMLEKTSSPVCADCVTVESTNRAYEYVSARNIGVAAADSAEVDLLGSSAPSQAKLELLYTSGDPYRETSTINGLRVYRGTYDSRMSKDGHKTGRLRINLVEDPGKTLHCDLVPAGATTQSTCVLKK